MRSLAVFLSPTLTDGKTGETGHGRRIGNLPLTLFLYPLCFSVQRGGRVEIIANDQVSP
jgi:hypothetical protein